MGGEVRVAGVSDLPDGEIFGTDVGGRPVALVREGDDVYAFENDCSHQHCPLDDGEYEDGHVICVCHGSAFDLATGDPTNPPATQPIPVYDARVEGDDVYVTLE